MKIEMSSKGDGERESESERKTESIKRLFVPFLYVEKIDIPREEEGG